LIDTKVHQGKEWVCRNRSCCTSVQVFRRLHEERTSQVATYEPKLPGWYKNLGHVVYKTPVMGRPILCSDT